MHRYNGEGMRFVELFAGIGGFSLGFERAGHKCVGHVEINPYAQKVLLKHWPDVPLFPDVRELKGREFRDVEILCGGFPCQPFSSASRGRVIEKSMWKDFERVVRLYNPKIVVVENVNKRAIKEAKEGLEDAGYKCKEFGLGAYEIGAPHKRNRQWLCAHANNESKFYSTIDAKMGELPKLQETVWGWENYSRAIRVPNGLPNRVDRLKCLGNALVPQIAEYIGRQLKDADIN